MADRDITGHTGTCPDVSRRDITGQGSLDLSRLSRHVDPPETDPASRWRRKADRRRAGEEWEQSGGTLDTIPEGLVSASLDACRPRSNGGERWRR